jgi:putative nucleotidyltransferase with HDIG domain
MRPPVIFLNALAHAFSAVGLYSEGHPARAKSLELSVRALEMLFQTDPRPTFSFLKDQVVYGREPLRELKNWGLAGRLKAREIERIEFSRGIEATELDRFLVQLAVGGGEDARFWSSDHPDFRCMRFGPLSMKESEPEHSAFNLGEQHESVAEMHHDAARKGKVSGALARTVVDTITAAMRSESRLLIPLVPLKRADQYTTVHSMNTSVLSMALGEYIKLAGPEVKLLGEAALLHDVGKSLISADILNKPGKLDPREWDEILKHPVEGARILVRSGQGLDIAAIAAYEHHLRYDGGGYPELHYKRRPHRISQLIHLCDAYDAMRTTRPFQAAKTNEEIIQILVEGAGTNFAADLVRGFVAMMREWDRQVVIADGEESVTDAP